MRFVFPISGIFLGACNFGNDFDKHTYCVVASSIADMSIKAREVGVPQAGRKASATDIRNVQNVALADATAKSNISPWTGAMMKVSAIQTASIYL
jgi:hypothetical protein